MYFSGDKFKKEYDIKTQVYINNHLPTIIIYPNEIGVLDYTFHSKLRSVLNLHKFKKARIILRYTLNRYLSKGKGYLFFSSLFWFYLSYVFIYYPHKIEEGMTVLLTLISCVVSVYYLFRFILNLMKYFYYKE